MNKNLLTIPDLCSELEISKPTAYALLRSGQLPYGKIGRKIVIHRTALEQYIHTTTNYNENL